MTTPELIELAAKAATEIEILTAEREAYASAMDRMKVELEAQAKQIDELRAEVARLNAACDKMSEDEMLCNSAALVETKTIEVPATEANNYSRILSLLELEEEGDPVAKIERLLGALRNYFSAADAAWIELCQEALKRGITSMPILPGQAKAMDQYNELRRVVGPNTEVSGEASAGLPG